MLPRSVKEGMLFLVRRWVAGETAADAVRRAAELCERGMAACIDYLGEHDTDKASVQRSTEEYLGLIKAIAAAKLEADVSLKPSELGMDVSAAEAERNIGSILAAAKRAGLGAWLDMESSAYTDRTLALHKKLRARFPELGIAVQANLKRTPQDLARLLRARARVRLVKGAYREPAEIALTEWRDVTAAYAELIRMALRSRSYVAVATHDPAMVAVAESLAPGHRGGMEFQLLLGIGERLKKRLAGHHRVRVYIPYGARWQKYVLRRIRERKRSVFRVLRLAFS